MKITLIGPVYPYRGGIAHHTTLLAQALGSHHSVQVISFSRQYPNWLYPGTTDKDPSQATLTVPADYWIDSLNPFTWWTTARRITQSSPDLVIFAWWTPFLALCFALITHQLRRRDIPVIFLSHNILPHEAHFYDRFLVRLALCQPQAFIVQAPREVERLAQVVPGARVRVCSHPVYSMFAPSGLPREEARRRLNLPPHLPIVLFFGIVRPYKGLKVLLQAIAQLRDQGQPVFLLVAGEFWENRATYDDLIIQLRLDSLVRFEDRYIPNEEVPLYFSVADVFSAPYQHATQSGAAKMAQGFGVPMVVTEPVAQEPGFTEAINCRVVPVDDPRFLAEAVCALLAQPTTLRQSHGLNDGWDDLVSVIEATAGELRPQKIERAG